MIDLKAEFEVCMYVVGQTHYQKECEKAIIDFAEKVADNQRKADGMWIEQNIDDCPLVTDELKETK